MNVFRAPRLTPAHRRALYRSRRLKDLLTRVELRNFIASLLALTGDQAREERLELLQTSPLFRCFYQELLGVLQAVPEGGGPGAPGDAGGGGPGSDIAGEGTGGTAGGPHPSGDSPPPSPRQPRAPSPPGGPGERRGGGPARPQAPTDRPREVTRRVTACEGVYANRIGLYW